MNKKFKLKIYKLSGPDKGDLDHEELFNSHEEMNKRYNDLFVYRKFSYNPTAWKRIRNEWERIEAAT